MERCEEQMRSLLCRWSFLLDKRAARDARAYKASIDAQAFEAFMDTVIESHKRCVAGRSNASGSSRPSP
eukprot:3885010-Prorocentrum_lima.AAC.1